MNDFHAERYAAWMAVFREALRLCHRHRYVYGSRGSQREIRLLRFAESMTALHSPTRLTPVGSLPL
jgi:hypothetical protein